ncbi:MAG: arginine--tRNA ligase [Candidatus Gribaldobacteria bacterium]|nr:arginine--tRNA ligase [Candidatus Gribaldobacteria bacterium]
MNIEAIKKIISDSLAIGEPSFVFPPNTQMGDLALECFALAGQLKKSPTEIASSLAENFPTNEIIEKATAVGPYVNFQINRQVLFSAVLEEITNPKPDSAKGYSRRGKIMVEYLSPNTNKPLHLGHLRNGALGMAVANILQFAGYGVIKANLVNDRGVHICKSMLAWQKWADGATPQSTNTKGDHFVGQWYIRYAVEAEKDPNLEQETQEMLQKWEQGDQATLKLWEMMNSWVYEGFKATYERFGLQFDATLYESQTYKLGKNVIQQGIDKGVFQQTDNGAIIAELSIDEFGLDQDNQPKKITLQREDGTSVYMTQDLGTAVLKFQDYKLDQSIYVVGSEQNYHFRALFWLLEKLGYPWAKNCHHLSYGMVYLPEGKMKSREGKVVDADDLIAQMEKLAQVEIEKRSPGKVTGDRALTIALSAIKFYLLRVGAAQDIHFNPQDSLSFEGFTGPYCQYAYARAKSIVRSAPATADKPNYSLLGNEQELLLAQKLMAFNQTVATAGDTFNPSKIALYAYDLAKSFNQFYQKHSVLNADNPQLIAARLSLVSAVAIILQKSLNLLGIETLEQM